MTAPAVVESAPAIQGGAESSAMDAMIEKIVAKPMPSLDGLMQKGVEVQAGGDPQPPTDVIPQATEGAEPQADGVTLDVTEPTAPVPTLEIVSEDADGETVLRARDPKTGQFSEMDQSRTYELSIKDKATGETKVYQKSLPDLMRLAKDGISTQKFKTEVTQAHDELTYYRSNVTKWQQTQANVETERDGYKALAMELLTSPEEQVVQRREMYAADQTPEKQIARERQALAAEQNRLAAERQSWQYTQHVNAATARLAPAVQQVESLVGPDAAAGYLARNTMHLMINGRIPPEHFPHLQAFVEGPYLQWAQGEAARITGTSAEATKLAEAAKLAQRNAQSVVNGTGRLMAPTGTGRSGEGTRAPFKDVNDAIEGIALGRGRRSA